MPSERRVKILHQRHVNELECIWCGLRLPWLPMDECPVKSALTDVHEE